MLKFIRLAIYFFYLEEDDSGDKIKYIKRGPFCFGCASDQYENIGFHTLTEFKIEWFRKHAQCNKCGALV